MNRYRALWAALALLVGVVLVTARPGSTAANRPGTAIPVGFVDMEEVTEKSVAGQTAKKQATELKTRLESGLEKKGQLALLTAEQRKELDTLQGKNQTTDAEKARIAELQAMGERVEKELLELQQKKSPTAADQARITELTTRMQSARTQLMGEQQTAQKELNENMVQLMTGLQTKIMKAVEEVAKEKGLAMVVHKEARLFGGEDITDSVINRLKK